MTNNLNTEYYVTTIFEYDEKNDVIGYKRFTPEPDGKYYGRTENTESIDKNYASFVTNVNAGLAKQKKRIEMLLNANATNKSEFMEVHDSREPYGIPEFKDGENTWVRGIFKDLVTGKLTMTKEWMFSHDKQAVMVMSKGNGLGFYMEHVSKLKGNSQHGFQYQLYTIPVPCALDYLPDNVRDYMEKRK